MEEWHDFFVATAGSAAALTGLIFVGISISLKQILSVPSLPSRAMQSLSLLIAVLIISSLCLAPRQGQVVVGTEILLIGSMLLFMNLVIDIAAWRKTKNKYKKYSVQNIVLTHLAILPYILAGAVTLLQGFDGIYWLLPAITFSFMKSSLDAWVLVIEIHR